MLLSRAIDLTHDPANKPPTDDSAPSPDSLTARLWDMYTDLAKMSLDSDYVQGVADGNLNPDDYCNYTVQDVIYCYDGMQDCRISLEKAVALGDPELIYFMGARLKRLVHSVDKRKRAVNISDPTAIIPGPAAKAYIDLEEKTAKTLPPVYYVLAAVPCLRLWAWMTSLLMPKATPDNIYQSWIIDNNDWSGAFQLENFVNDWFARNPATLDMAAAEWVYQGCMLGELNFFRTACGQSMVDAEGQDVPMPTLPPTTV